MDTVDRIFGLLDKTTMEQKEFAALVGVSVDTASDWRRRRSGSYTKKIAKIAEVLNTTVEYLLTGENKEPATETGDGFAEKLSEALKEIGVDVAKLSQVEVHRIARLAKAALEE